MTKQVVFIQFYQSRLNGGNGALNLVDGEYISLDKRVLFKETILSNGFSSIYQYCCNNGDFLWVKINLDGHLNEIIEKNKNIELPFVCGTAYISAYFNVHLYQAYLWAKRYPEIDFIVGGPAVDKRKVVQILPSNLSLTEESLTKTFETTENWGINLPDDIENKILIGHTIERNCYWEKCLFCTYPGEQNEIPFDINFTDSLPIKPFKSIFLSTPALSPNFINNKLPLLKFRKDLEYWSHVRCDQVSYNAIHNAFLKMSKNGFDLAHFCALSGIEYPSNRMLKWMQKGSTTETILECYKLFRRFKCKSAISLIFGWNNLIESDVYDAEIFFKKLKEITGGRVIVKCHSLAAKIGTPLFNQVNGEDIQIGPFLLGKIPYKDEKQVKLNDSYREKLYSAGFYYILDQSVNSTNDFL